MSLNWILYVDGEARDFALSLRPQQELSLVVDGDRMIVTDDDGELVAFIEGPAGKWLTGYDQVPGTSLVARVHRVETEGADLTLRLYRRRTVQGSDGGLTLTTEVQLSTRDCESPAYDPLAAPG